MYSIAIKNILLFLITVKKLNMKYYFLICIELIGENGFPSQWRLMKLKLGVQILLLSDHILLPNKHPFKKQ